MPVNQTDIFRRTSTDDSFIFIGARAFHRRRLRRFPGKSGSRSSNAGVKFGTEKSAIAISWHFSLIAHSSYLPFLSALGDKQKVKLSPTRLMHGVSLANVDYPDQTHVRAVHH